MTQQKVLVIHALRPTSRQTTIDHLLSFREHLRNADVQYLHFAQPVPKGTLEGVEPDLLIVNYDYLNYRFTPLWPYVKNRYRDIARRSRRVVAITQDDFWAHRLLDNWCMSWKVDRVLTPIENDLQVLYPRTIRHAEFRTVLTGYAPTSVEPLAPLAARPIDLGQRVRAMPAHLGAYAQEKYRQTIEFSRHVRDAGFVVDVSTQVEDSFVGADWPKFLRACKFTVGMKGGASIADPYGLLYNKVEAYRNRHSSAHITPESVRFLRRRDGRYWFSAVSPRLFEAAAAGTCQILRRDNYLGVLEPWIHYLPLASDVSNVKQVVQAMRDMDLCQQIAINTRVQLIESGQYSYRHLVSAASDGHLEPRSESLDYGWQNLKNWLHLSAKLSTDSTQTLSDTSFHLIHETLRRTTGTRAEEVILEQLERESVTEWYRRVSDAGACESLNWRMPWIPRLLPIH